MVVVALHGVSTEYKGRSDHSRRTISLRDLQRPNSIPLVKEAIDLIFETGNIRSDIE